MGDGPETASSGSGSTATVTHARAIDEAEDPRGQAGGLVLAAHPVHALLVGVTVGAAAYVDGRPVRETLVAGGGVLVVQAALGLLNDARDETRDRAAGTEGKPVAEGRVPAGNASFVAVCLLLLAVPLALENGSASAVALLGFAVAGALSLTRVRRTLLSWLPWAVGYALLPAYLSYGGWGLGVHGAPPTWAMTVLAGALGVGVHALTSLPHLVADNRAGVRHLPLRIALRTGATPLLVAAVVWTAASVVALLAAALTVGLRQ